VPRAHARLQVVCAEVALPARPCHQDKSSALLRELPTAESSAWLPLAPGESAGRHALVTIDLSCPVCGSNRIALNHAVSDACEVVCEACGTRVGTYVELKQAVAKRLVLG
jgi:hypothetical protein